jgi:hypothetical protein
MILSAIAEVTQVVGRGSVLSCYHGAFVEALLRWQSGQSGRWQKIQQVYVVICVRLHLILPYLSDTSAKDSMPYSCSTSCTNDSTNRDLILPLYLILVIELLFLFLLRPTPTKRCGR